jgi:hypothetical protein
MSLPARIVPRQQARVNQGRGKAMAQILSIFDALPGICYNDLASVLEQTADANWQTAKVTRLASA